MIKIGKLSSNLTQNPADGGVFLYLYASLPSRPLA